MKEDIEPRYDHTKSEPEIYKLWEESGYFNPDNLPTAESSSLQANEANKLKAKSYSIVMPPPNANGDLHAGHALFLTIQDILTRYKRMRGFKALWLPGADHAGFETQIVYEKQLEKEGRSRFGMDPKQLYDEIMEFTLKNKKNMEAQVRGLGASCDWSREKFTLDPDVVKQVQKTFVKMYDDGLIYRGKRIINWCPKHQTSLSDVETEFKEQQDPFYYFKYGPFTIGTARPETKFGDKYVVMHPNDGRYKKYKDGQKIELEWINGPITATIVKDEAIDMEFGTGVMTITPWHDAIDFEIAERHGLEKEQIIDFRGKLLPIAGEFAGKSIKEARPLLIEKLKNKGLLEKVDEKYTHNVRVCYKCETAIEPQIMDQWFVKMKPLAEKAIEAVKAGKIKFIPERYGNIFYYFMENTLDWNISRQIVWGIQIPAWFCFSCGEVTTKPNIRSKWFIVRHGETAWNTEGRSQGHADNPLNETGLRQAEQAAASLKNKNIDLILSSDLIRARQTAEAIQKATGAELIIDDRLRERNVGNLEGKTRAERIKEFGPNVLDYAWKPEGGESYEELEERIKTVFKEHRDSHSHKNVVIVSHAGTVRMLLKHLKNTDIRVAMEQGSIKNATPLELSIGDSCKKCDSDLYEQDPDVFDTWFSSGQWPLLTLGFPKGKDFRTFYPTDVMETGYDLMFKWVPRMIIFGLYLVNEVPFKTVYLHGLVNDGKGKKMSKSKGNVISPFTLTEKYGTDALRIGLVVGNTASTDLALSDDKIRGYRNFATKLWNITRFVVMNKPKDTATPSLSGEDQARLDELKNIKEEVTNHLDHFEFHLAAEKLYHYVWHTFADKIIEEVKPRFKDGSPEDRAAAYHLLETILLESLKMLHPFMPFVTEAIYQKLHPGKLLLVEAW